MPTLRERLHDDPFQGYAYAYPHKTAYRHFDTPLPLRELWAEEDKQTLFLYLHLPFCEMRCGFCNLFTTVNPREGKVGRYLDALERQIDVVGEALGPHRHARGAIGGGTPTFLTTAEMARVFAMLRKSGSLPRGIPLSCELSPATAEPDKIAQLREEGVTRASIGVQSFIESETRALGRPQKPVVLHAALERLAGAGFPVLNVDLIYGIADQTAASWRESLVQAVTYRPQEIFLYPLYIRPLTGLGRKGRDTSDQRLSRFREARDFLRERGYRQISLRLFRHHGSPLEADDGANYCCQEDGMIGYGAGARSYTRRVHYCTEYAVGRAGIEAILDGFVSCPARDHGFAWYGCELDAAEQKRRYLIKSLLRADGLDERAYEAWSGSSWTAEFPELQELLDLGLAVRDGGALRLTEAGLERSDTLGPWLYSEAMTARMEEYELA
jgi:oxygen-independent coproporphyrinogen-3 oxidase